MNRGKLYLIPNRITENTSNEAIPEYVKNLLKGVRHFLAEDIRTARRYFSSLRVYESIEPLQFQILDKNTRPEALKDLFLPVFQGHDMGVVSESGCPGVADPGALAVKYAHENEIQVVPLVGPSSLLLALMASGLNGQRFAFQGYLPIDVREASRLIKEFEKESRVKGQTQIFIETPYRNDKLLKTLIKNLSADTLLCVALDITGPSEMIKTLPVKKWSVMPTELGKIPSVFLFLAS